jgi:membrane protein required for colicin V production
MTWVDWAIVIVLASAVLGGLQQGFLRSVFSLFGLFAGLALAAWNYAGLAALIVPFVPVEPVADTIAFLVIAIAVMGVAGFVGQVVAKTIHRMGLGCLDRLAGAAFGLLQGALLVTLCILVALAFFPHARWLTESKLPKRFFGACQLSTHLSPTELAERVMLSLKSLEEETPHWIHPGKGGL